MSYRGEQCVLCASPSMTCKAKEQRINQLKYQIRAMFVVRKLLEISSSTCSDLLKFGNPAVWFSYCADCFETVIEAEIVFSKLIKLEAKFRNLKKDVEEKIWQHYLQNKDSKASSKLKVADGDIIGRIWNETVERLRPALQIDVDSINVENELKIEIDEEFCSNGIASPTSCNDYESNGESDPGTGNDAVDKSEIPISKNDYKEKDKESTPENSHGSYNLKDDVGRRTRSGRLIKSKYISESDDDNLRTDELEYENDSSDYTDDDEIKPNNAKNKTKPRHAQQDELSGQPTLLENLDFQCKQCPKSFQSFNCLRNHEAYTHVKKDEMPFQCSECGKGMLGFQSLGRHMQNKHPGIAFDKKKFPSKNDKMPFQCSECGKGMVAFHSLGRHMKNKHPGIAFGQKKFSCEKCSLSFTSHQRFKGHMYEIHKSDDFDFQCTMCNKKFVSAGLLDIHTKAHHDLPKDPNGQSTSLEGVNFQCKQCGLVLNCLKGLMRHEVRAHVSGKEKPFPCEKCHKGYFSYIQLHIHNFKEHKGPPVKKKKIMNNLEKTGVLSEEKFPCEKCSLSFASDQMLKSHMYEVHKSDDSGFQCTVCDKKLVSAGLLDIHTKAHHDLPKDPNGQSTSLESVNFQCKQCGQVLNSLSGLIRHEVRTHVSGKQKPYPCENCHRGYFSYKQLRFHHVKDHKGLPLQSKKEMSNLEKTGSQTTGNVLGFKRVRRRMQKKHPGKAFGEKKFPCDECSSSFCSDQRLKSHMYKVHKSDDFGFQCTVCDKKFVSAGLLDIHSKSHLDQQKDPNGQSTSLEGVNFQCKQCGQVLHSLSGLMRHEIRTHVSGKEKPYPCEKCHKGYFCYKQFRIHNFKEHKAPPLLSKNGKSNLKKTGSQTPEKSFACERCELMFVSVGSLEKHIVDVHDKNFTVQCQECPKRFKSTFLMKHHLKCVHWKQKDFICEICSMSFLHKLQLKYHQMRVHEKSEELRCKECGHMSMDPFALKRHIANVHNKNNCAFKCPMCDYRTINKSSLNGHIIRLHTNKKPFSCTFCDKSYGSSSALKIHMRTHTGERPFACQFCGKTFARMQRMKRHEEDLHSTEKPYQCELCGKTFPSKHYLSTHVYDVHRKRQKNPVPEKILISDELLKEVINQN